MGAEKLKEFFENKSESFEKKTAALNKLRNNIEFEENADGKMVQAPDECVEKNIMFLHTSCEIVYDTHPDERMPVWVENIRYGYGLK